MRWLSPTRSSKCLARSLSGRRRANRIASSTFSKAVKPGQQIERLEHVADPLGPEAVALGLGHQGDVPVVDPDLARVGPADAGDDVQQRRLAAAASADHHHLLAGGHAELGNVQHGQLRAVRLPE